MNLAGDFFPKFERLTLPPRQALVVRGAPFQGQSVRHATSHTVGTMLAHYHGQTFDGSEIASALGLSQPAVRRTPLGVEISIFNSAGAGNLSSNLKVISLKYSV